MSKTVHAETVVPITWEGWDEQDSLTNTYYTVTMTDDFGPAKKGEKYAFAHLGYGDGVLELFASGDEEPTHRILIRFQPI